MSLIRFMLSGPLFSMKQTFISDSGIAQLFAKILRINFFYTTTRIIVYKGCTEGWLCIDESKNKFHGLYYVYLLKLCVCLCPLRLFSFQSAYKKGHLSQKWSKSVQVCFWPFLGHYQGQRPNFDTKLSWAKHNAKVSP